MKIGRMLVATVQCGLVIWLRPLKCLQSPKPKAKSKLLAAIDKEDASLRDANRRLPKSERDGIKNIRCHFVLLDALKSD